MQGLDVGGNKAAFMKKLVVMVCLIDWIG